MKHSLIVFFLLFFSAVSFVSARIGVGVATGKIVVDQPLKPGQIYALPPFTVVNTGDEESGYKVDISYHQDQSELRPPKEWLAFSPKNFNLKPGESRIVDVKLHLPVNAEPGEYFIYLEGQPDRETGDGRTQVGIAAASKMYFTVEPANLWWGIYYKVLSIWNVYAPWPKYAAIAIILLGVVLILRRFLNIKIDVKSKRKNNEDKGEKGES